MTRLGFLPVACLLFAAALASAQHPASGRSFHDRYAELVANPRRLSDSTRLGELFRVNWEYVMTEFPEFATYVGYPGQNARWTDNSLQAIERRKRELEEPLAVVKAIRRDRLSSTDRLNYDLFRRRLEEQIEGNRFKDEYLAITQLGGVQQDVGQLLAQMPTTSVQDYVNILARLNGVPALVDQAIVLLGRGLEAGITPPRVTLRDVPDQIRGITPDDPMASPLLQPFAQFPPAIPASERERLTRAARDAYTQRVAPAYRKLYDDFVGFLRTDPQFFYDDSASLVRAYRDIAKRADPGLIKLFGKLPRLPYGVTTIPSFMAKSQTTAYYQGGSLQAGRPGYFFVNTYDLKSRPKWEMEALSLHEAVPGHHLQIALAQELDGLPEFRRYGGYTAFVEGWGLYAEGLGPELGMYQDPYSKFGQLTYEMWRAVRLVLDTGIHAMGWTREQALQFFKDNAPKAEQDIVVEVDRYIAWPGQALAYKIGQLKFRELRDSAAAALGARFDIRAYHDEALRNGALPLDLLEQDVREWMRRQR